MGNNIFIFGIGGIGISALARMFLLEGKKVTGSDLAESLVTKELEKAGVKVIIGQDISYVPKDTDLIIYTVALTELAPELFAELGKLNTPVYSYPEMLGIISKEKYTIAIAGTHGKTTTTAMVGKVLIDAKFDPTIIVGSLLKDFNSNFVAGNSKYLVVEADEYRRSFINLNPSILVITNIDEDHLDYYKDIEDIKKAFIQLVRKIPKEGVLICNSHAPNMADIVKNARCNIADFSLLDVSVKLLVPGEHNIKNAKAALAVGKILNIGLSEILSSLKTFSGTWRRFELKGKTPAGALVYDDYAHNPQKVRAALLGAKEAYPDKKIIAVFQPHLYSRTKFLLKEFAESFNDVHEVIVLPIYAAREKLDSSISSEILCEEIKKYNKNVQYVSDMNTAYDLVLKNDSPDYLVITMGAGDITELSDKLIKK
ncbi:MAG: UDP-N-acetylmuramate--L-alanine ligase [Candidatus Taylorbacteria bacterium]|nr:UDP-N-acetylmuramate--L-alanine ligase [Candidatus Taylorbacteria bacterium]